MKTVLIAVMIMSVCAQTTAPTKTEHGWRTQRVIATRYSSPQMGESIGLTFPLNPNDCDREEVADLIAGFGGSIYQGGGSPGAEAFVVFDGVTDIATADKKILQVIPVLSNLMASIDNRSVVKQILAAHPKPPYKCKEGEYLGTECGGNCVVLVCRNNKTEVDDKATQQQYAWISQENQKRDDLLWAMRTRVLTDKEMEQVRAFGTQILIPLCNGMCSMPPESDLQKELNDLLFQQVKLRTIAGQVSK